jgi:4-oxalocrotonate tautomerase family enzyme
MPYIQCEIHAGLSVERKQELSSALMSVINKSLGSPMKFIHVAIREVPGTQFVEAGEVAARYPGEESLQVSP